MNHGQDAFVLCCLAATTLCGCGESRGTILTLGGTTVWHPAAVTSWQIQLTGTVDTTPDVQMFDIDLFDVDASVVATLQQKAAKVICHISAGSFEAWRSDAASFPASVLGNTLGSSGERWLDIRATDVLGPIMKARLDICRSKGFDGVDVDTVDGYTNTTGFPLMVADQLAYNRFLATEAHARGLAIGLVNDVSQAADLVGDFDWILAEQCFQYDECDRVQPFVDVGKAVFHIEFNLETSDFCPLANTLNFNSMKKNVSLDAARWPCR
jgi:hypothetical protein